MYFVYSHKNLELFYMKLNIHIIVLLYPPTYIHANDAWTANVLMDTVKNIVNKSPSIGH